MADVNVNIADLISEFGQYYRQNGQGVKDIRKQIFTPSASDELFMFMPTTSTRLEGANVDIAGVLQPYQDDFTAKGDIDFAGRVIDLKPMKIDWSRNPTPIWNTWMGFLAGLENDRSKWPFIRYIIEQLIIPASQQDWETDVIFNGIYAAPVAGTPGAAIDSANGLRYLMNEAVDGGDLSPIVLGAVPSDEEDFCDYVEAFAAAIPKKYWKLLQQIAMSDTLYRRYLKGKRKKYNMAYAQEELTTVADTPMVVKGYTSHEGSSKIWTTVKGNTVLGVNRGSNESVFEIEKVDRKVKLYTDFWKGVGAWRWDFLFTNDVDLAYGGF